MAFAVAALGVALVGRAVQHGGFQAAFQPTLPAPSTTTRAGRTPGAPPISTPRPPLWRSRKWAPIWGAKRPATSLMGARRGSAPDSSCTVS